MKRPMLTILGLGFLFCAANAQDKKPELKPEPPKTDFSKIFKNDKEKISYALGMNVGSSLKGNLKSQDVEFDMDTLVKAFEEAMKGSATQITDAQDKEILNDFRKELRVKQQEKQKLLAEKNKKEGAAFLEENKTKPGVITLPSGLQYKILTEGTGDIPKSNDTVVVNYRGTLLDGTEFDSSYKRGQPATFKVTGVIKGWTEALELMKTGSKWQLFIPSDLAYHERGSASIGPNATLTFDVELVSIKPPLPAPPAPAPTANTPLTSDIIKVPSAEELKKGAKIETIKAEDIEKEKAKANN
jgi:FKBP-type peptidyl-prolyl cis-trans isomerase FklB